MKCFGGCRRIISVCYVVSERFCVTDDIFCTLHLSAGVSAETMYERGLRKGLVNRRTWIRLFGPGLTFFRLTLILLLNCCVVQLNAVRHNSLEDKLTAEACFSSAVLASFLIRPIK